MALQISVYQWRKDPKGYRCVYEPGQKGIVAADAKLPPFYIREQKDGKTKWTRLLADTLDAAKTEAESMQTSVLARAAGVEVVDNSENRERLSTKIKTYLAETEANKSINTIRAYSNSMRLFQLSCKRMNVADVTREDMLAFKTFLKNYISKKNGKNLHPRSVYNHFLNTAVFFTWATGKENALNLKSNDWPPKVEREPEAYTEAELNTMIDKASKTERLIIRCYLSSGLRNSELMGLTYGDVNPRTSVWTVQPTSKRGLKTKAAQRSVAVPEWLTKLVVERQEANGGKSNDLIFPGEKHGGFNKHIIEVIKRVAEKAGVGGRVDVHKFRATSITMWLRAGLSVPEVMALVGHRNPQTILRYAEKVNLAKQENRNRVTAAFEQFAAGD